MFQLQRAIIRPKTEQSPGTFSDCALYGMPYRLHFLIILYVIFRPMCQNREIKSENTNILNVYNCQYCETLKIDLDELIGSCRVG